MNKIFTTSWVSFCLFGVSPFSPSQNRVAVQILMWPQLLQIFKWWKHHPPICPHSKHDVWFSYLTPADQPEEPDFAIGINQCHYSSLNTEKSNFQEHPILPVALVHWQPRSVGDSCHRKPGAGQDNIITTSWKLQHKYNQLRKGALAC